MYQSFPPSPLLCNVYCIFNILRFSFSLIAAWLHPVSIQYLTRVSDENSTRYSVRPPVLPGLTYVSRPISEKLFSDIQQKFCIVMLIFLMRFEKEIFYNKTKIHKKLTSCPNFSPEITNKNQKMFSGPFSATFAKLWGRKA